MAAFSADGATFKVFDQTTLSQQYLSRYFKHNNWGSFVRQLNLYGFTSSRLKDHDGVVVWNHELFHRDHIEWLANIKRTKKTKTKKTSPPISSNDTDQILRPSSSSPQSFLDAHGDVVKLSGADREWLESRFDSVNQHNRRIEEKLDFLIKHTIEVDFTQDIKSGSKRPRGAAHGNSLDIAPASFQRSIGSHNQDPDDSFKSFIDMMLDNPNEESKTMIDDEYVAEANTHPRGFHRRDSNSAVASILNSLGSEAGNPSCDSVKSAPHVGTEWIPRANHLENKATGPAPIYSSQVAPPIRSSSSIIDPDEVPEWVAVVPSSARSTSPESACPAGGDEEQGAFMDMTLVSAHLVESITRGITVDNSAAQILADQQQHARQLSKRVMWAIAALIFAVVVSLTSTIIITRHEAPELAANTQNTPDNNNVDSNDYIESYEYETDKKEINQISDSPIEETDSTSNTPNSIGDFVPDTGMTSNKYTGNALGALPSDETSIDYSLSEGSRRWKDWDAHPSWETREQTRTAHRPASSDTNIFDRHLTEPNGHNVTQLEEDPRHDHNSYSELSLKMNGEEVETLFHCYRQL